MCHGYGKRSFRHYQIIWVRGFRSNLESTERFTSGAIACTSKKSMSKKSIEIQLTRQNKTSAQSKLRTIHGTKIVGKQASHRQEAHTGNRNQSQSGKSRNQALARTPATDPPNRPTYQRHNDACPTRSANRLIGNQNKHSSKHSTAPDRRVTTMGGSRNHQPLRNRQTASQRLVHFC